MRKSMARGGVGYSPCEQIDDSGGKRWSRRLQLANGNAAVPGVGAAGTVQLQ
jgi:hypothetical protein